jgi:xylan 1,4-beta-xylosidase
VLWDFTPIETPTGSDNQHFYRKERPSAKAAGIHLTLHGLRAGAYRLTVYRVGYGHNDAYTAYLHIGAPAQLTRQAVASLQKAASGDAEQNRMIKVGADRSFEAGLAMNQNDVVLVEVSPIDR